MMLVGGTDRRYLPAVTAPAARPRPQARWKEPPAVDPTVVAALASELSLPPVVCELLVRRGFGESDGARRFLRPRLDQLHPPSSMRDLDAAVDSLAQRHDRAGDFEARNVRGPGRRRVAPEPLQNIGPVHSGKCDLHQHLAGPGSWPRSLPEAQHIGRARPRDFNGFHEFS